MNEKKHDNSSKQILLSVLAIAILVVAVVGISFAAFTYTGVGTKENTISTGTISMTYTEDTNGISITNAMPTTDAAGKVSSTVGTYFDFTVSSTITGSATIDYEITAIKDAASSLSNTDVKLYLEKKVGGNYVQATAPTAFSPLVTATSIGSPVGSMVLYTGQHTTTTADIFRLRMWLADTAVPTGTTQSFTVKVNVYGKAA